MGTPTTYIVRDLGRVVYVDTALARTLRTAQGVAESLQEFCTSGVVHLLVEQWQGSKVETCHHVYATMLTAPVE